ncbi:peptidase M16 [Deltaproteobacteria bacterium]|nr:peptidase M16 [Deltaproteobacteria bacterium]
MRFVRPVLAAALLVGGAALATEAVADAPPKAPMQVRLKNVEIGLNDFAFPSGMRILFQEDHSQPVVSLTMMIDHGSQDDPEGREGIAHLIEHLWFRSVQPAADGTDAPKIMDLIKQIGAQFNATTAADRTNYLTVARSPLLPTLLRLESLRLDEAVRKVTNENVLVEREVVRNELRLNYENGGAAALGFLFDKLWPVGHPYHHLTIGTHDSLNAITLADIQKYVNDYYNPSEATLVVAGDFDMAKAADYLNDAFPIDQLAAPDDPTGKNFQLVAPKIRISGAPKEPPTPSQPIEVKGEVTNLQTYSVAVEKAAIVIGWPLPTAYTSQDAVASAAVSQLSSAIRRELYPDWEYQKEGSSAEENTDIGCFLDAGRYGSTGICWVDIGDEDPARMVERALNGVYTLYDRGDNYASFQKYFFNYSTQASMARTFQSVDEVTDLFGGRSAAISDFVHFTGDPMYYSRQIEWNGKVTIDQVRDFAGKYFKRDRAVAVAIKPIEDGDLTIDGSDSAYRGQSRDQAVLTLFKPEEVGPQQIKETIVVPDTKKIVQETMANGMKLVIMPHTNGPLVQVGLTFNGGPDSAGMPQLASIFGSSMWDTPHFGVVDPLSIAGYETRAFGGLGGNFRVAASAGNVRDASYSIRYRMDDLIADTDGRIDWVKANKGDILKWMKKPDETASRLQSQRLFPGHPYGEFLTHKDWDTIDKMGVSQAQTFLATILRPKNATMYVVGNIEVDEARDAAKTYFGGWGGWGKEPAGWTPPKREYAPPPPPPARQILLFNKDNVTQTQVSYQCQLAPITPENEWSVQVMADVVSDGLWLALREQTGASYGAYPYVDYQPGGVGIFGQGVSVQNDSTAFAVKVFIEQGEKAIAGKLDDRIVATQKFNNAQAYVLGQVSTAAMYSRLVNVNNRGWGMEYFDKVADRIGNVQQKDFPPLLDRCVGHEVITAVGPLSVIKPQFDKLGMTVEVVDVDAYRKEYRAKMGLKEEKEDKKKKDEAKK